MRTFRDFMILLTSEEVILFFRKLFVTGNFGYLVVGILIFAVIMAGTILSINKIWAQNGAVTTASVVVPVSCTLSGNVTLAHNATMNNGLYEDDIGVTVLKAFCNDVNGFSIYAIGYTSEEDGNTKLEGVSDGENIINTGINTSGNTSAWAMKLTATGSNYIPTIENNFNNYHVVPENYIKVASYASATDVSSAIYNAVGSTLTTTYAAYISNNQVADTYVGKVKYVMVHPVSADAPVVCNKNATTISEVRCMQDFAHVTSTNLNSIINSMTPETQYTLKDSRDGKSYTIAKYQTKYYDASTESEQTAYDIWMTKNLDLDLDASRTYTNEDTDIGYNTNTGTYTTAAWSPERSTYPTGITTWGLYDETDDYYGGDKHPESYDLGDLYIDSMVFIAEDYLNSCDNGSCDASLYAQLSSDWKAFIDTCISGTCDMSIFPGDDPEIPISSTGIPQYHLGNYYNWTAAVAMNDSSTHTTYNEIIEQSICPTGWTLPRIGYGEDSFYALWNQYGFAENPINGANKLWTSPLYFVASGRWHSVLYGVGWFGRFWSPVVNDEFSADNAEFYVNGHSGPSYVSSRGYGHSVRCIARPVVAP